MRGSQKTCLILALQTNTFCEDKIMKKITLLCLPFFFAACGTIQNISQGDSNQNVQSGTETAFLFATDYSSSGQLMTSDDTAASLTNTGVTGLGSSAIIKFFDGKLYLLSDGFSRLSLNNVQILDPSNSYRTIAEWSTGDGTNPQDIVVSGDTAYISLYNPDTVDNLDSSGNPGDLIVMDLNTGLISQSISFHDYLNADGDLNADAGPMVLVGSTLYVAIQDLQNDFSQNTFGKIAVIDTTTNAVTSVITLQGRDPVDLVASTTANKLYVADEAPYDFSLGNFDTTTAYGGLEVIDLSTLQSVALLADETLGGYIERLASGDKKVFAVASQLDSTTFAFSSTILSMDEDNTDTSAVSNFVTGSEDVREIVVDSVAQLWVSRRAINATDGSASDPEVDAFDIDTGAQVGTSLIPTVAVTSITFGTL